MTDSQTATIEVSCWRNAWGLTTTNELREYTVDGPASSLGVRVQPGQVLVTVPDQENRKITVIVGGTVDPAWEMAGTTRLPTGELALEELEFGIIPTGMLVDEGDYQVFVSDTDRSNPTSLRQTICIAPQKG